jgi:hypothetical protein
MLYEIDDVVDWVVVEALARELFQMTDVSTINDTKKNTL